MMLAQSDVRQFRSLYKKYFGVEVSEETAREKLIALVRQLEAVYLPDEDENEQHDQPKKTN